MYCSNAPVILGDWNGEEESRSDSSGDITNFMREGFWYAIIPGPVNYEALSNEYVKEDTLIMYITYQDIQYYNNALLFEADNPIDVVREEVLDEAASMVGDKIADIVEKTLGVGRQFSFMLTLIDVLNEHRKAVIEKELKENHQAAQQLATDRRTGMFVVIKQTRKWAYRKDITWPGGGYFLGPKTTIEIKYYAAAEDYSR